MTSWMADRGFNPTLEETRETLGSRWPAVQFSATGLGGFERSQIVGPSLTAPARVRVRWAWITDDLYSGEPERPDWAIELLREDRYRLTPNGRLPRVARR